MALYSDYDSLQGPSRKLTMHNAAGAESLQTAPFIATVSALSQHAISLSWQVIFTVLTD